MTPEQIIAKIKASNKTHLVYRLDGKVKATPSRTPSRESMGRRVDVIGVYGQRATPEMVAEDLEA